MIVIRDEVKALLEEVKICRRHLHEYPEIELDTPKTKQFLMEKLKTYGDFIFEEGFAKHGFVAYLCVNEQASNIGFRADMDALPIQEQNEIAFKSKVEGKSHACGHDGHMAILLGLAKYLSEHRHALKKNIVFIFQPGEEGPGGAELMIQEGLFEKYPMECIFGTHLMSDVPAGKIACTKGAMMARNGELEIDVYGQSAHGAMAYLGKDAIVAASALVMQLQSIVSRSIDPLKATVLTIGKMSGGEARNVISDHVNMLGTLRSFDDDSYELQKQRINEIAKGIEIAYGVRVEVHIVDYYYAVVNDEKLDEKLQKVIGNDYMKQTPKMIAEDFSFYQREVPGLFFFSGVGDEIHQKGIHDAQFNFNEASLLNAIEVDLRLLEEMEAF
ncbi:MAG: amidohydrolase [Erysipelotrichia bacterium]|nr:amidohydrolase [Erysipelotrichia bacterium]NCC54857.1 amidohydrolase [Erysipelotrichia bacterium]